ncbi:hypothetical protein C1I89_31875 [Achromobacter pulmonis]|uniref:Methyltransferase FkbM domain-containing protein n=1 Tax=Achromobacter pulmonis TaxID=1389932 RepID=A0A2N8K8Z9_9BURK|nr:FkbM family methyltransferase [Achromobacter pulmonis]PND29931.1 hypothetical protein C1I89_31875 [Achromobacter pulmonis]
MGLFYYQGRAIRFPPTSHAYFKGFWERGGFYEQELLEHIARVSEAGIFIDVGANTENHSLYFALFCPSTQVLSFEPNREHKNSFEELMRLNDATNVALHCFALSGKEGHAEVTYVINKSGPNRTSLDECHTLDRVLSGLDGRVAVMKIDVEGHELEVLHGAQETLKSGDANLYIECIGEAEFEGVSSYLKSLGYEYSGLRFNATPTYEFVKR